VSEPERKLLPENHGGPNSMMGRRATRQFRGLPHRHFHDSQTNGVIHPCRGELFMHSIDVQHASWYRALTLTERLASLERTSQDAAVDWGRAERRLARWQGQYPFSADGHFA
jgi:hypothetical protein